MGFDYCAVLAGIKIAYLLHDLVLRSIFPIFNSFDIPAEYLFVFFPFVYLTLLHFNKWYTKRQPLWDNIENLLKTFIYATSLLIGIMFFTKDTERISRIFVIISGSTIFFFLLVTLLLTKRLLHLLRLWNIPVVIIGTGSAVNRLLAALDSEPYTGQQFVGLIETRHKRDRPIGTFHEIPLLGWLEDVEGIINRLRIRDVVIALPAEEQDQYQAVIERVQPLVKNLGIVPHLPGLPLNNLEIKSFLHKKLVFITVRNNLLSPANQLLKRLFDLIFGMLLFLLTAPIMAIIWVLIKLDSPGPGIFSHQRIGIKGRPFLCYKFRSMISNSQQVLEQCLKENAEAREEWESSFKLKNDPRITRIGRLLRQTSLDEIPQFWNVIKGNMSLVGPRPITAKEVKKYSTYIKNYYLVRPGITGLWQINGRNDLDYDQRVQLDAWYASNWTLWLDISLIIKTIKAVLTKNGAY